MKTYNVHLEVWIMADDEEDAPYVLGVNAANCRLADG